MTVSTQFTVTADPGADEAAAGADQLTLSTTWVSPTVVRITAAGEVDASNVRSLREYVFRRAANCQRLILDLQGVKFFGTDGLTALHAINSSCERAEVNWMLLPSSAVSLVLRLCDPDRALPVAKSE